MAKGKKEESFENNLKQLETIVRRLEGDELTLEESLTLFEEGVKLADACSERLDAAEKKVVLLLKSRQQNTLTENPFMPEDNLDD